MCCTSTGESLRSLYCDKSWGSPSLFDLGVNTDRAVPVTSLVVTQEVVGLCEATHVLVIYGIYFYCAHK